MSDMTRWFTDRKDGLGWIVYNSHMTFSSLDEEQAEWLCDTLNEVDRRSRVSAIVDEEVQASKDFFDRNR